MEAARLQTREVEHALQSRTVKSNGAIAKDGGANPVSGYSLIEAKDYDEAAAKAKGCPILAAGGSVEVAEAMDM